MSARGRIPQRVYPGGHIGPPLRGEGGVPNQRKIGAKTGPCLRGGTEPAPYRRVEADQRRGEVTLPYGCNAGGAQQRADVPKAWLPPAKFRAEIWGVSHRHRAPTPCGGRHAGVVVPYGWLRRAAAIALGSGAQRSVCAAVARDGWKSEQRSPLKGPSTPDNPSVSLRLTAPFAQGSLWGRGVRIAASALRASSQ